MPKNASTTTAARAAASKAGDTVPVEASSAEPDRAGETAGDGAAKKASARRTATVGADGVTQAKAQPRKATKSSRAKATKSKKTADSAPPVPEGTDWMPAELAEVRADLVTQLSELRSEYDQALADLSSMQQTSNDGAGDDQADAGTKTFEREQEMSIAHNRLDLLTQMERALDRIDAGTYGRCESCSTAIAKARLQAFPSATLCVVCKQREERR